MPRRANTSFLAGALLASSFLVLQALFPLDARAADDGETGRQAGEDRWVPSLSINSGVFVQRQKGHAESALFVNNVPPSVEVQPPANGNNITLAPFVGASLELMAPALPIPTRPRFFVSGELVPTFGVEHTLAVDGDPGCVKGPEPGAPCTKDETALRLDSFGEGAANGQGSKVVSEIDTLVFAANAGVSFPAVIQGRQVRIKPSVGWINYELTGKGEVVDAECQPGGQCTDEGSGGVVTTPGFLREVTLTAKSSRRFDGIGPGLDVEMEAGRFGQVGASLLLGGRAYYILNDRTIAFGTSATYNDAVGVGTAQGRFRMEIDEWMFRGYVGIRFSWLGPE